MYGRIRRHLTFANVMSTTAVFIALGGGAIAATRLRRNEVKSRHIAPNAARGVDIKESSLGTVPRAANAANASRAGFAANAGAVDGYDSSLLQLGDGISSGASGFLNDGEAADIGFEDGVLTFGCDTTAGNNSLVLHDFPGDSFSTDVWVEGDHTLVADGQDSDELLALGNAQRESSSRQIHVGGFVSTEVLLSYNNDNVSDQCLLALNLHENGFPTSSTSVRGERRPKRAGPGSIRGK